MSEKTYKVTLTEKQMVVIQNALEEYFRLRLGQTIDFADDITSMGVDLSDKNPNKDWCFDMHIANREWVEEIMKAMFRVLWKPYGVPEEKTNEMMVAECLWDSIRCARGKSHYPFALQLGSEPIPEIEVIK